MGTGVGIFLITIGAILRFALETSVDGINLAMTGVILMVIGVIGLLLSLAFWSSLNSLGGGAANSGSQVMREVEITSTRDRGIA